MALQPGTTLGPYEILSPLGAGGMGEVYKALDTRLDRTVAIKMLPEHVAADPDLKQRFEREAKTISSLNHPHICTLHDIGEQDGIDFLVMEYLEGDTLAQRLEQGALPLDQALKVAIEIADALDKAHRQGIVHRDLKPGNIMLTKAGAKLLDFGLAKMKPAGAALGESAFPTKSASLTQEGTILGTLQYMAPEQLEGQDADTRTDIFAFGTVVYEMVTGRKTFEGKSQASLIAAIMHVDPPALSSLQSITPPALDPLVKTCLAKDPDERWQSAGDLGRHLRLIREGGSHVTAPAETATAPQVQIWQRPVPAVVGAVVLLGITGLVAWGLLRPEPPRLARFPIATSPPPTALPAGVVISPDGMRIIYVASTPEFGQLFVRAADQIDAVALRGAEAARAPFISHDGEWVGFITLGEPGGPVILSKVSIHGGTPIPLTGSSGGFSGASWGPDDTIIFAGGSTALTRVSAAGGESEPLTTLEEGETAHRFPHILPGGRAVLFTVVKSQDDESMEIAALNLDTGERIPLLTGGSDPHYVSTGHLIYGVDGTLRAVPFDLDRLTVTGDPVPVLEDVVTLRASLQPALPVYWA